jgi:hypothetical protein
MINDGSRLSSDESRGGQPDVWKMDERQAEKFASMRKKSPHVLNGDSHFPDYRTLPFSLRVERARVALRSPSATV